MSHPTILNRTQTALVVVDLQEAFRSAIPDFPLIAERTSIAVRGFQILDIPIIITEQYPKGLGGTVEEIRVQLMRCATVSGKIKGDRRYTCRALRRRNTYLRQSNGARFTDRSI